MYRTLVLAASLPTLVLGQKSCASIASRALADEPSSSLSAPPTPINETVLARVRSNLLQNATKSWELGTASQALIEFSWPAISVFNETAFPPKPATEKGSFNVSDVLEIADRTISQKSPKVATLVEDGAAGDPPSLGIAVLYANVSDPKEAYSDAAESQLYHLLNDVPRYKNGAISHRESEAQLWADFIAMAPPFIAYYGALHENKTLLATAYNQTKLYRQVLRDPETGLWKHILGGSYQDESLWATGNAWAAWGLLRVHQTLSHSTLANEFVKEQEDLLSWTTEIVLSAWEDRNDEGILYNTLGCNGPEDDFGDTASTALLTGVTYRLAQIYADATKKGVETSPPIIPEPETNATASRSASAPIPSQSLVNTPKDGALSSNWSDSYTTADLTQPISLNLTLNALLEGALEAADEAYTTISETYLTKNGWLQGAVDPLTFTCQLDDDYHSPEGQAFVLIMEASRRAWNDWVHPFPSNETVSADKVRSGTVLRRK